MCGGCIDEQFSLYLDARRTCRYRTTNNDNFICVFFIAPRFVVCQDKYRQYRETGDGHSSL